MANAAEPAVAAPNRNAAFHPGGIFYLELLLLGALLLLWRQLSPGGLSANDWQGFILAATPLAVAAMAQTLPIIAGGQGLSAGATMVLVTALVATTPMSSQADAVLAVGFGVAIGAGIGCLNGVLIGYFGLRSTPVTLATGAAAMAVALQHLSTAYVPAPEPLQSLLYNWTAGGISVLPPVVLLAICVAGELLLLSRTGAALRARAAHPITDMRHFRWPVLLSYTAAGAGAALGGVLLAGAFGSVNASLGAPVLLQILAAIALGGGIPGLRGGSVAGSLLGALIVVATGNLLVPLGVQDYFSTSIDALWLLLGFAACLIARGAREQPQRLASFGQTSSRLRYLALLAPVSLLLFNLRPAAGDLAILMSGIALLAVGQAAVWRHGTVDLSMPSMISVSAIATVALTGGADSKLPAALTVIIVLAMVVGFFHGWLASRFGRAAIVGTLATAGITQALSAGLLITLPTGYAPGLLAATTTTRWFGVPFSAWVMIGLASAMALFFDRLARINVRPGYRYPSYLACSFAAAVFGVFIAGLGGSVHYSLVDSYSLPAITAAMLTCSLSKGDKGSTLSVLALAVLLVLGDTVLVMWEAGYAVRIGGLAALLICGECFRAFQIRRRPGSP
ncbi:ABC transporter permease [Mesorhizobium sp. NZP2298]|uniref:ABC transporter permease n=1 Tax=Mesorhizobium sp. NZP2298 TaxID=2483403 RepID=UPI0015579C93|nr:hypothetical protein [Mesorhizobium sp. NZP2298]